MAVSLQEMNPLISVNARKKASPGVELLRADVADATVLVHVGGELADMERVWVYSVSYLTGSLLLTVVALLPKYWKH